MKILTKNRTADVVKYRIYVCAAKADREDLLRDISKEIFEHEELAIYYREPGDESELAVEDICRIQICVVLVTADFLAGKDVTTLREFRAFADSSIPVLPILVEENLETWFDEVCGNLHCLKKSDGDFKKHLKNYMEQVLASDELYEKIKSLFKRQIFISYRKKDKEYIFKLIHKLYDDEGFSDTAVWYDEFLVPGENFDEAILKAMDASDLFVLAVTAHLLECPNYVINEEYPYAQKIGMEILPVHNMSADPDKLKDLFENIPEGVDYEDTPALHMVIRTLLETKKVPQGEEEGLNTGRDVSDNVMKDAYKEYYLGMAFLKGICVEYRPDRGIEYITRAAEAGVPDAVERLVFVYKNGDGTEIDYEKAAEWQKKVAEIRKVEPEAYYQALLELIILLQHAGKTEEASDCCDKTIAFLEDFERGHSEFYVTNGLIEVFKRQMDIETALGNFEKAQAVCGKCISALKWVGDNENKDIFFSIQNVVQRLGYLSFVQCNLEDAEKYYQTRLQMILKKKGNDSGTSAEGTAGEYEISELLVNVYIDLFDVYFRMGKRQEAELHIRKAMEMIPEDSSQAINCYERMGDMYRDSGEYFEAEKMYLKALEISEAAYEKTRTLEMKRSIAVKYCKLGILCNRKNELDECIGWFEKYKKTGREVLDKANISENRRGYATACVNLAEMYDYKDSETAIACLKDAELMFTESADRNRNREEVNVLMRCGQSLVNKYMQAGKSAQAYDSFVVLANLVRDYYLKTKDTGILPNVAEYYMTLAEMTKTETEIVSHLQNSVSLYEDLVLTDETESTHIKYGNVLLKLGIYQEQKELILKAREVFVKLRKKSPFNIELTKWIVACDKAVKKWGK